MLLAIPAAGALDEDAPHGFGRGGEETPPTVELLVANERQIRFVDEGSGVEGVAGGFSGHARGREHAQLVVDEREQVGGRLAVTGGCGVQQSRHIGLSASVMLAAGRGR
jgi:hypothetical protein